MPWTQWECNGMGIGYWGFGIGDWVLGIWYLVLGIGHSGKIRRLEGERLGSGEAEGIETEKIRRLEGERVRRNDQ